MAASGIETTSKTSHREVWSWHLHTRDGLRDTSREITRSILQFPLYRNLPRWPPLEQEPRADQQMWSTSHPLSEERQNWSSVNNVPPGTIEFHEMTDDPFAWHPPRCPAKIPELPRIWIKSPRLYLSNPVGLRAELAMIGSGWYWFKWRRWRLSRGYLSSLTINVLFATL